MSQHLAERMTEMQKACEAVGLLQDVAWPFTATELSYQNYGGQFVSELQSWVQHPPHSLGYETLTELSGDLNTNV